MEIQILDYILVPSGLILLVAYHIWLVHRIIYQPMKTAIGVSVTSRHVWAESMMESMPQNRHLAVQTIRNNMMAGILLATASVTLNSIIVLMLANFRSRPTVTIFGDQSELLLWIKVFSVMFCFLLAFLFKVQSLKYYSHASFLVQVPVSKCTKVGVYVAKALTKGTHFWAMGLRASTSFPPFMWFFGSIPIVYVLPVAGLHTLFFGHLGYWKYLALSNSPTQQ